MNFIPIINLLWGLFFSILGFNFIIFVHEFGHFIFCKIFGVSTPVFSIGMGKPLVKFTLFSTQFQIASFPIGGYVSPLIDEENKSNPKNLLAINYFKKMTIILAGIFFNLFAAFLIYSGIFYFKGVPSKHIEQITIQSINKSSPANEILKEKDTILGVNSINFAKTNTTVEEYLEEIKKSQGKSISFKILRDQNKPTRYQVQIPEGDKTSNILQISFQVTAKNLFTRIPDLKTAYKEAFNTLKKNISAISTNTLSLIKNRSLQGIAGPVSILKESFSIASKNLIDFLLFLAFLSINLALLNVLPIGILDGGKALSITLEAIGGNKATQITNYLDIASLLFLGVITVFVGAKEIIQLNWIAIITIIALLALTIYDDLSTLIKKIFNK